jgi:hypothetical protein
MTLDMEATIRATAAARRVLPILRPGAERRFSAHLVLDVSPSMLLWDDTFTELVDVFAHVGAFREVRPWRLHVDGNDVSLADSFGRRWSPGTFRTTDRRRLVIIVTDAVGEHWYRPVMSRHLTDWGSSGTVAVVDLLPVKLWSFSGIGPRRIRVHTTVAAAANARLSHTIPQRWRLTRRPAAGAVPVPVVELTPTALAQWSAMVAAAHPVGNAAMLLEPGASRGTPGLLPDAAEGRRSLTNFLLTASPEALRLAVLAATSDSTTLAVLRAIQQELLPESAVRDLAEVLVSGIFQHVPGNGGADLRIRMNTDSRVGLLALASPQDQWDVYRAVSAAIRRANPKSTDSFQAAVHDPLGNLTVLEGQQAFAEMARAALTKAIDSQTELPPHRPVDQQPTTLAEVLAAAEAIRDDAARARALTDLAPYLPPDHLTQALASAVAISDDAARARALTALIRHLPSHQQPTALAQALAAAAAIGDDAVRVRALAVLVPHLPSDQQPTALAEVLAAAEAIRDDAVRARALAVLAPHLPSDQPTRAEDLSPGRTEPEVSEESQRNEQEGWEEFFGGSP